MQSQPEASLPRQEAVAAAAEADEPGMPGCPVSYAPSQPLPPGHPPVPTAHASTLKPPSDPRCVFFRTQEDLIQTPPLSRSSSAQAEDLRKAIDANRLKPNEAQSLNPDTSVVLASRNSQLALVQTTHVSAMLSSHFGAHSPAFISEQSVAQQAVNGLGLEAEASTSATPPLSPISMPSPELVELHRSKTAKLGITSPVAFPITSMSTAGDQNLVSPLYVIGGEGRAIWTKELEVALAAGAVDAIVHCLKDVPTLMPDGLVLGAILEREDPRDALCVKQGLPYKTLDELPPGSVIGTSSVRRVAQLRRKYPNLVFSDVRGNLNTRLSKLDAPNGPYTALILAAAGLIRLNLAGRITAFLSAPALLHSVGQGSLTIEVRRPPPGATPENNRDARILAMVQAIGDWRATWRQEAERSLLRELEGGCSIPVGVESRFDDHDEVEGARNENMAVRQVDIDNGHEDEAKPTFSNGHTIPASQILKGSDGLNGTSTPQREGPPPLKRLATGQSDVAEASNGRAQAASAANGVPAPATGATSGDIESLQQARPVLMPEDRATEPTEGVHLTLTALVVSLDGTRSSDYSLRRKVASLEDAQNLGITVAKELAQHRGARVILDEVERHRKLAEEADDRRRRAEKEKRMRAARSQETAGALPTMDDQAGTGATSKELQAAAAAHRAGASANGKHVNGNGTASTAINNGSGLAESEEERENRRRLEGLVRAGGKVPASVVARVRTGSDATVQPPTFSLDEAAAADKDYFGPEIDRRGRPRDDGQPKAWEV